MGLAFGGALGKLLWPPVTDPTTVPTAHGPVAMVPGRRGCGSAPGRRAARVSGRILAPERSRMRGHSERSLYATGRAVILKPTAVGCRPSMSGLRYKAIYDEIRKLGYPSWSGCSLPPPPPSWYGGKMEVHSHGTARYDQAKPAKCLRWSISTMTRNPNKCTPV